MQKQILKKMERNLTILGISSSNSGSSLTVDSLVISLVDASIQSPMGGVNDASAPYLGIGVAAPGQIKIKGASGQNSIAAIFTSANRLQIMKLACDFGNDVIIEAGDSTTELARIRGHVDFVGVGQ